MKATVARTYTVAHAHTRTGCLTQSCPMDTDLAVLGMQEEQWQAAMGCTMLSEGDTCESIDCWVSAT